MNNADLIKELDLILSQVR